MTGKRKRFLDDDDDDDDDETDPEKQSLTRRLTTSSTTPNASAKTRTLCSRTALLYLLIVSLFIISIQTVFLIHTQRLLHRRSLSPNGLITTRTTPRTLYSNSIYTSPNETLATAAWEAILAGHGVVALSSDYVTENKLGESVQMPDESGRYMYAVEAYHAMHCIQILRRHYTALRKRQPWPWPVHHDHHCFDALRQYVMCNIDDTLLWTEGRRESGVGQEKLCQDWGALREWAEERSAGYFDVENGTLVAHNGNYHEGDGLVWA